MDKKNTLVFSIATNGYDQLFEDCIDSQRAYCQRMGYKYLLFNESYPGGIDGTESSWMKVPLLLKALEIGYEWVVFFDADCLIRETAPDARMVDREDKYLYLAKDAKSELLNPGVIIAKSSPEVIRILSKILSYSDIPGKLLPKKFLGLYEMGHFNYIVFNSPILGLIDPKWNNNSGKEIGEYIWHGATMYHRKPRAQKPKKQPSKLQRLIQNLKKRPRVLRLKKLANYFWNKFYERDLSTNP